MNARAEQAIRHKLHYGCRAIDAMKLYGVNYNTYYRTYRKMGLKRKLLMTPEQVKEFRSECAAAEATEKHGSLEKVYKKWAAEIGISRYMLSRIKNRLNYKYVD